MEDFKHITIITSQKDLAGINIKENLINKGLIENKKIKLGEKDKERKITLITTQKDSVYSENIDQQLEQQGIKTDLIIFATKHQSKAGINSLSVHSPGNWSSADFGGQSHQLCTAPANYLRTFYLELLKYEKEWQSKMNGEIVNECTHHGPFVTKPVMFIEIGSTKEAWQNKRAGGIISETLINVLSKPIPKAHNIVLGIGGLHTCPIFNKVIQRNNIAFSHICPKYQLEHLNQEILQQALERTIGEKGEKGKVDFAVLDWKGLGKYKQKVVELLASLNLDYKRPKELGVGE